MSTYPLAGYPATDDTPCTQLYQSIWGIHTLTQEATRTILKTHDLREIRGWHRAGHPLLHEAAENCSIGAEMVLDCAFADVRLRSLFTDPTYVDKYGYTVLRRINYYQRPHLPFTHQRIAQALLPPPPQPSSSVWWWLLLLLCVAVVVVCSRV